MTKPTSGPLQKLRDQYTTSPKLRAIAQFLPWGIGSAIDSYLENMAIARSRAFFDELAQGEKVLTRQMILNEEFLHRFYDNR